MFVWTFLLRITHTIIFQSSADSSWNTLYNLEGFIEISTRKSFRVSHNKTVGHSGWKLSQVWRVERAYWVSLDWSRCPAGNNWAVECLDDSCRKFSFPVGLCGCLIPCLNENDTKSYLIYSTSCANLANVEGLHCSEGQIFKTDMFIACKHAPHE